MSRIGMQIMSIRSKKGMNQKQLGKQLGVSEKFIVELESGKKIANEDMIKKISKILGENINDYMINDNDSDSDEDLNQEDMYNKLEKKETKKGLKEVVKEEWNDAFSSILKTVPVYKYNLKDVVDTKRLPIVSNKVEGYAKDKVVFLEIEDNDMIGFRMGKGDIAFGYTTHEVEHNSICLLEYNNKRVIRQIKKIDNNNILLISNKGSVKTESLSIKDIKILVKLNKIETKL